MSKPLAEGQWILIVEDDLDSAEALAFALERVGYRTRGAASATEALLLLDERPGLMLLDLHLSDVGGVDLVAAFQASRPLPPVVVISAAPVEVIRSASEALGAAAALRKPFSVQSLLDAVRAALDPVASTATAAPRARRQTRG